AALLLVRLNDAEVAPMALATTLYEPAVPLAVALVLACPPAIVMFAVAPPPVRTAEAFAAGAVKVMTPPLTGSPPTPPIDATKGDANGLKIGALCGEPLKIEMVKPRDSNAPMSTVPFVVRLKPVPRWSVNGGPLNGGLAIA